VIADVPNFFLAENRFNQQLALGRKSFLSVDQDFDPVLYHCVGTL
jgi:hypothetical protein